MSDQRQTRPQTKELAPENDPGRADDAAAEIERLEAELARFREALERIRDQTFEHGHSQRLIDQLWHFVRWSKSVAREALDGAGSGENKGGDGKRKRGP